MRRLAKNKLSTQLTSSKARQVASQTGLFIFDNAPSHQSARPMLCLLADAPNPNKDWSHKKDGPRMRNGKFGPSRHLAKTSSFSEDHATMQAV